MTTVAFHTLGCKVNHYETEGIWRMFKEHGYERVDFDHDADVYVINTCTVTNTGDKKSRQVIRRAIRKNPEGIVCVTGCYAQTSPGEIMEIPGVDIVVGTQDRKNMLQYIEEHKKTREPINGVTNIMKNRVFEEMDVPEFTDRTRASLKIQEGCNNFCTFCIIPWSRGLLRSRDPESVVDQAQKLVDAGYKEIVLTGIHTAGYGEDMTDYNFAMLLNDLETKVKGLKRIRISSIEASQITDEVIEALDQSEKIVRHLHIPLQSGSDSVLARMRRKYSSQFYKEKVEKIKKALPGLAITSDVIVGFPGETDEEFMETYDFIKDIGFSELHVFPFSRRTGTPAARMNNQVNEELKNERVHQLIELSNQLAKQYAANYEDEVLEVIPEEHSEDPLRPELLIGYTDNYLKVQFEGTPDMIGKIVRVKLTKAGYPINEGKFVKIMDNATHSMAKSVIN
ncbi:tRNA (N(6)-L-threonylcarbamoyladenosine(37)-C(2))-methylthiotransferase MtaB [Virgibacillus halodenitrificans]|uniref:Threonylcarbamoyladenosine tRNA methylthiotransferase MtaB n=1 Tax=Virgibacillus halodenitrificans TaxID=1482 RepID=A0AAC9NKN7_VIRHA|nr:MULTISPECIES: tRNA (N(6)-L-threonylcarbamoyladenosine(37)-C(2))-methylthiotransferase MtaB [Virgibacillus]AIF43386.1 30S ribosomal protein S12 methylthiotransferase [Virgibacillus sp. SK37]APC48218.1 tRNA (N(6)-L-threonylcarbamoyladenosine(37)-C(2))-methylthiotransferase MtaB [Virgibacillus halodenitrificans]MBD1222843.1 tRNA (N(6)-L-threonylcarbamoyladenosine(37)-C(2))-methylthiotransferase MtaB [Virgibacillus halodenitrificans]MEC2160050.1 tRNA (N(6)-L-threonylcarbamoyladenosine(37)-C(2))-